MDGFKLLVPIVFLLTVVCFVASEPIPQTSTTNEEKKEVGAKPQVPPETPKKSEATADKSTGAIEDSSTSCGGLKGFLHLCQEKNEVNPKQKRSLNENEEDGEENDADLEKMAEETDEDNEAEKLDVALETAPSDVTESKNEIEVVKRQTQEEQEGEDENSSEDEVLIPVPALAKRQALNDTTSANLTSDNSPAPLSPEFYIPVPQKRQEKETEEDDTYNDDVADDDDQSDENDEEDKR